ncbi:MAG: flagellar basal-body MS-ring/collar protein FliF, partial [Planctomycetota bacterium]
MSPELRSLPSQLKETFSRFTTGQKTGLVSATALTVFAILVLLIIVNRPQYTILFSNLSPSDASLVRDKLQDEKITYQLREGGSTILVPKDQVYECRLILASDGIPSQPGAGYELFDRTNLGMSDFVQKLNYRRALEGELGRTVSGIAEVEQARVHVVMPEPALFREDEKETTASVVLKLKARARLKDDQVQGISILVARAVEGLEPENVTILDSYGNLLSGGRVPDPMVGLSSTQLELQHTIESYLASKAQTMLDGVLGPGKSIVRVSSELDFQTIERTREIYDPESAVVRSEERTESETSGADTPQTKEENSLSNYEINKTVEHIVNTGGSILRLSAAVLVDGQYELAEDRSRVYTPRSDEEMTSLTKMVRGALGIREDRGDVLEVTNIAFDKEPFVEEAAPWQVMEYQDLIITLLPKIILGIVLLM